MSEEPRIARIEKHLEDALAELRELRRIQKSAGEKMARTKRQSTG
jgi:hypothetical protein